MSNLPTNKEPVAGNVAQGRKEWAGEYRGADYWGFTGLRGLWNATFQRAAKCMPNRVNSFDVPDLTDEELAALEAAAKINGLA